MNFIIKGTIYPFDLYVSVDEDDKVLKTKLEKDLTLSKRDKDNLFTWEGVGRAVLLDCNVSVIRLKTTEKYLMIGTIAHEVFHFVCFLFHRIGLEFEATVNDEAYAYMIAYYVKEITEQLNL